MDGRERVLESGMSLNREFEIERTNGTTDRLICSVRVDDD